MTVELAIIILWDLMMNNFMPVARGGLIGCSACKYFNSMALDERAAGIMIKSARLTPKKSGQRAAQRRKLIISNLRRFCYGRKEM